MSYLWPTKEWLWLVPIALVISVRGLAHYVGDDDFSRSVISGSSADGSDAHSRNAAILECDRPTAKNYLYAYMFGAGASKLGSILTGRPNPTVGKASADKFG